MSRTGVARRVRGARYRSGMQAGDCWALVVPGHGEVCEDGRYRLSRRCLRVLAAAARLADGRRPRVIVFSGWAPLGGPSEAAQMLGAWPGRRDVELLLEETATVTAENVSRTLPLLLERGIREATVVCAPLHAPRARYLFGGVYRRFGIRCEVDAAASLPTPGALAWELGALAVVRRQRRAALVELES